MKKLKTTLNFLNIFNLIKIFNSFKYFDKITEFRLINAYIFALAFGIIGPILIILKGQFMLAWIISLFSIFSVVSVKFNEYMVETFDLSTIYKIGVMINISLSFSTLIYFYSPMIMVYVDSFIGIIEVAVFSSYSIMLNNYITKYYPDDMNKFQIVRNSTWADGQLLGLLIVTILTFFYSLIVSILFLIIFEVFFNVWLVKNWHYFDENEKND